MPAYPRMFHVARRVYEGCGVMRSPCGMCWFVCACLDLLLLAWLCGVVVGILLCCWSMVGGMGESMWAQCCCMMLLVVYMCMLFVVDMPCCGLLMFCHSNCSGCGWCKRM